MEVLFEHEKKVLELDSRRRLFEIVRDFPGCHFRQIERKSGLPTGTVKYHLDYLSKSGLVKYEKKDNNLRYYPRAFKPRDEKLMGFLRQKQLRRILILIMLHKNCNHEMIVKNMKLSPSTISWHLKRLRQNHIIEFEKKGRKTFYYVKEPDIVIKLLITYKESFFDVLVDRVIEMWDI